MLLPPVDEVVKTYSKLLEKEDVDSANRFLASVCAMAAYAAYAGALSPDEVRNYADELRVKIVEGPEMLNPYVFALLGDLIEDPNDIDKIKERLIYIWSIDQLGLED